MLVSSVEPQIPPPCRNNEIVIFSRKPLFLLKYAIIENAPAAKMKGTVSMNTSVTNASHGNIEKEREELIDLVRTLTPEEVEKVIDRARQLLVPQ